MSYSELSHLQWIFWNIAQGSDDGPMNQSDVLLLRGPLDVEALQKSFDAIVRRQDILRSRLEVVEGTPMQVVDEDVCILIDQQDFTSSDKRPHLNAALERCIYRTFDLTRDYPLRIGLFKLAENEHVLAIVSHHIINDDRSAVIMAQELSALYNAYVRGQPSPLVALPGQYADFARQQNEYVRSEAARQQLEYWRRVFAEAPRLFGPARTPGPLPPYSFHMLPIPADLVTSLQRDAQSQGVSLFVLLLAAYKMTLAKRTGVQDVTVSTLLDGRRHAKFKNVIGAFPCMHWLRTQLPADLNVPDTIGEVRRSFWKAYGTQGALVEWQRTLSEGTPGPGGTIETSINFHNSLIWHWRLDGLAATRYFEFNRPEIQLEWDMLWFDLDHQPEGIYLVVLYGRHRFSASEIQTLADEFLLRLKGIHNNL